MNKRIFGFLLVIVLLAACLAPAALAEADAWVKLASADGSLHLRKGPGKTYGSAGYVKHGDAVDVAFGDTGVDSDGEEWTRVYVERTGKSGYIKTKYISDAKVGAWSTGPVVSVSGGSLHVRTGPGTDFASAGYVLHGQQIDILAEGSTWTRIRVKATGVTGYIKNKYIIGLDSANTAATVQPAAPTAYDLGSVMTKTYAGQVNVRSGAGTGYASVGKVGRGTQLKITGQSGNWYKVTAGSLSGWISKNYVSLGVTGTTTVNLNFRTGAGTGYALIDTLDKGTFVTVHSVTGKWARITAGGSTGYAWLSYLKI